MQGLTLYLVRLFLIKPTAFDVISVLQVPLDTVVLALHCQASIVLYCAAPAAGIVSASFHVYDENYVRPPLVVVAVMVLPEVAVHSGYVLGAMF